MSNPIDILNKSLDYQIDLYIKDGEDRNELINTLGDKIECVKFLRQRYMVEYLAECKTKKIPKKMIEPVPNIITERNIRPEVVLKPIETKPIPHIDRSSNNQPSLF